VTNADGTPATGKNYINQAWNGVGADPRGWRNVPSSSARYTIELLPAAGQTACDPTSQATAQTTMIDPTSGTFRIRATGQARVGAPKRSIIATFKRRGFLDFLYFTDFETLDPVYYPHLLAADVPTGGTDAQGNPAPDIKTWAGTDCTKYWRDGRGSATYPGKFFYNSTWNLNPPASVGLTAPLRCYELMFVNADVNSGPLHTNDELLICGAPTFGRNAQDQIEVSAPPQGWRNANGTSGCTLNGNPTWTGTFNTSTSTLGMPPTNATLKSIALPSYTFTGQTTIVLSSGFITVNGVPMSYPANGVIYVKNGVCGVTYDPANPYTAPAGCGDAIVSGTYNKDLTIATEKDIIINDPILKSSTADVMLGLIPNDYARVYHPVAAGCGSNQTSGPYGGYNNSIEIDAAILALTHSFVVDNFNCGLMMSTLTVKGAIAQKFRGPVVHTNSSGTPDHGYLKAYSYDDRLHYRSPPNFLDPVQASWRLARQWEQSPAR
jgi:hypothetical protein